MSDRIALSAGQMLAHYRLDEKLGEGAMGVVWKATDTTLDRDVAIKTLRPEFSDDPERSARFRREAKALARLNHPNIVTIHSFESAGGVQFLTMELVAGKPLSDIVSRGGLPLGRFLELAVPLAEAIGVAHEHGICHRDLKQANVLLADGGSVKIVDFGLAQLRPTWSPSPDGNSPTESVFSTRHGTVMGSIAYMSPEQLRAQQTDSRSDIFSLGVVMFELATGQLPFVGESVMEIISSVLRDDPCKLEEINPVYPPGMSLLVQRCLEKNPDDRFASSLDVRDQLATFLDRGAGAHVAAQPSIAVLPFADMSPGQNQSHFCEGMSEEITLALARLPGLRVASRTFAFQTKTMASSSQEIGQKLRVQMLLEGSVRRVGQRLRIAVELVRAGEGYQVWSARYDREEGDVFAVQEDIAANVARALEVMLTDSGRLARATGEDVDVHAFEYYLRGRQQSHELSRSGFRSARDMFARATAIAPSFARAYAGVANCCSCLCQMYWEDVAKNLQEADTASEKALALSPDRAEVQVARGLTESLKGQHERAQAHFQRALELEPRDFDARYFYGRTCLARGEIEEAARWFDEASRIREEDFESKAMLSWCLDTLGRKSEARSAGHRALSTIDRYLDLYPEDVRALVLKADCYRILDHPGSAQTLSERVWSMQPDEPRVLYNLACNFALLDLGDRALDCLERSAALGFRGKKWLETDPDFNSLRTGPRFQALLAALSGTDPAW